MNFLIDAQLPSRLSKGLSDLGFDAMHVDSLPKGDETSDDEIAKYADKNNLMVITKDFDFYHSYMALQRPKQLFLITTGNIGNRQLFDLIRNNAVQIRNLIETCNYIELSNEGIVGHE